MPIDSINTKLHMEGNAAQIDYIDIRSSRSDLHIDGTVSDLPAIVHHTDQLVDTRLNLSTRRIDLKQLTYNPNNPDTTMPPLGMNGGNDRVGSKLLILPDYPWDCTLALPSSVMAKPHVMVLMYCTLRNRRALQSSSSATCRTGSNPALPKASQPVSRLKSH